MASVGQIASRRRSSSKISARIQHTATIPRTVSSAVALIERTCDVTADRRKALRRATMGMTMNRRWDGFHDLTPPPATKHAIPSNRSERYSQG